MLNILFTATVIEPGDVIVFGSGDRSDLFQHWFPLILHMTLLIVDKSFVSTYQFSLESFMPNELYYVFFLDIIKFGTLLI